MLNKFHYVPDTTKVGGLSYGTCPLIVLYFIDYELQCAA